MLMVKNGSFAYTGKKLLLNNISFELEKGQVMAVLGPNGAGKSTLLKCMLSLLRWNEGQTLLENKDVRELSNKELWKKFAYVPQAGTVSSQYTVEEMIILGRNCDIGMFRLPKKEDYDRVYGVMEKLGISKLAGKSCGKLSGGELQMVLIARAIVSDPEVLVLDEPESGLDFENQLRILDIISELASQGTSCVFNTHYPAHALRRADKTLLLGKDGDYEFGNTGEIITEESIRRFFGVEARIAPLEVNSDRKIMDVVPLKILSDEEKI